MTDPSCNTYRPVAMFSSPFTFDRQLGAAYEPSCSNNACQRNPRLGQHPHYPQSGVSLKSVWRLDGDFNGGFEGVRLPTFTIALKCLSAILALLAAAAWFRSALGR